MTQDAGGKPRGPSDPTDYSSTKAPETQREAEESVAFSDERLQPGGALGTPADPGMSSLDRDVAVSGGTRPGTQDFGATEDRDRR